MRGLSKKRAIYEGVSVAWVGGSVSALVILFFLRGIVNSPHPEGLWILNGLWRWGKN